MANGNVRGPQEDASTLIDGLYARTQAAEAPAIVVDADSAKPINAIAVKAIELRDHIGKSDDDPLVGLALSGGGIRSATFGLGILQALYSLGLFKKIDYISTVSGGGYIGGWLQSVMAHDRLARALKVNGEEPREIRFLRAYSNYLTPQLGLFSGDTWAAVGTTLRNLILNFTILSLTLMATLYLLWLAAVVFWDLTLIRSPLTVWGLLGVVAGLLAYSVWRSANNMAHPLEGGRWTNPDFSQATPWKINLFVVGFSLVGMWLLSTIAWRRGHGAWTDSWSFWRDVGLGGLIYFAVWLVGLAIDYVKRGNIASREKEARRVGAAKTPGQKNEPVAELKRDLRRAIGLAASLTFFAFIAGAVGTFILTSIVVHLARWTEGSTYAWVTALLAFPVCVFGLLVAITVHIGLAGNLLSDETREWWARVGGIQLFVTLLLVVFGVLTLAGPHVSEGIKNLLDVFGLKSYETFFTWMLGAIWSVVTGAGLLAGKSERTSRGEGPTLLESFGRVAPVVFVVGYLLFLSILLHSKGLFVTPDAVQLVHLSDVRTIESTLNERALELQRHEIDSSDTPLLPWSAGLLLTFALTAWLAYVISRRVDLNEFSLHALYRNRLVRCYLGASNSDRSAHPFTGFDSADNLPLAARRPEANPKKPDTAKKNPEKPVASMRAPIKPYPIFNAAMNLVGGKNLAWQQRKAASFIFTPEYCGFEYRTDENNEQEPHRSKRLSAYAPTGKHAYPPTAKHTGDPLTLGLAMATSGAAASPNMGYHTSPTLAFLMTVFNVRLGWWLRNPRWPEVWTNQSARLSLREFLYELLGMTTDDRSWVYLSDGGHFENLGIYELVRRRCRFIIACDAGQDGNVTFEDLGNAIEKCRSDFGIDIEIDLSGMRPGAAKLSERHCAIGAIRYDQQNAEEAIGTLLYIKSSLTGDEPADVLRYASLNAAFPHQSTADQYFDESQFESYRALGYHIGCTALCASAETEELPKLTPVELFTLLQQHWSLPAPAPSDAITKYSAALTKIWSTVRSTDELEFLDSQMFPEWLRLIGDGGVRDSSSDVAGPSDAKSESMYWLPDCPKQRRVGFYMCTEMLQLMEDVYMEFALGEHHDHIDNRGWMNLFQHWSWSGMLCATWAITGSTYDPRFQRFCKRRLDLRPGFPYVSSANDWITLPSPTEWRAQSATSSKDIKSAWESQARLNFWEADLVSRFLERSKVQTRLKLAPIRVVVESPRRSDGHPLDFNVGYLIGEVDWEGMLFRLHHIRIQNHLRKMGLARAALAMIAMKPPEGWGLTLQVVESDHEAGSHQGNASDEAVPSHAALIRVKRIVRSLPRADCEVIGAWEKPLV